MTVNPNGGENNQPTADEKDINNYLLKDYELKVRYLSDHFTRMWTRFNFFLTLDTLLLGALIKGDIQKDSSSLMAVPIIGSIFSATWFMFAESDQYLARLYRRQVSLVHKLLTNRFNMEEIEKTLKVSSESTIQSINVSYAGDRDQKEVYERYDKQIKAHNNSIGYPSPGGWGTTELAIVVPSLFLTGWLGLASYSLCFMS